MEVYRILNTSISKNLKENFFGGSLTGDKFSKKHGDLTIEQKVNWKVKVRGGPMQGGYSTDLDAINIFVKNSHQLAKLRSVLKKSIYLPTSSKHEETTLGDRKKHENMKKRLVTNLGEVLDPFSSGPATKIKSGVLLDDLIVEGLLESNEIGEQHLQDFTLKRIKINENDTDSFFAQIKNQN